VRIRDGGIGEHGVLEAKGFAGVRHFNGRASEFERLDNFTSECSKMSSDGFVTISIKYEDTRSSVQRIIKLDEIMGAVGRPANDGLRVFHTAEGPGPVAGELVISREWDVNIGVSGSSETDINNKSVGSECVCGTLEEGNIGGAVIFGYRGEDSDSLEDSCLVNIFIVGPGG